MEIEYNSSNPYNFTFALHRIIDTVGLFFFMEPDEPKAIHASPIIYRGSHIILSSVSSDARRESSETLSFQGLPTSVWVLVGFSLLVVSGLATYFGFKNEKKNRRERHLNSWMNNVCVYAADIVNNCVAGMIRPGPGRTLRSWWLLGIVFLLQFWVAGMKSDLLVDKSTFIDSIEDLMSKPELILIISKNYKDFNIFGKTEDDPGFKDYLKRNIRYVDVKYGDEWIWLLVNGRGVILGQEISSTAYVKSRVKKLKEAKRKQYNGKERYKEGFSNAIFNKRLPRAIKEDIDYLTSRLFETGQAQPKSRRDKFRSREFVFDPTDDSAPTMSWSAQNVKFLSPLFRLWIIGMSLSSFAFCVEFYLLRRRPVKVSPHHSIGIRIRA